MKVAFLDLRKNYLTIKEEIDDALQKVIDQSAFAGGVFVEAFEREFAKVHKAKYCVGVHSGTSALHITLMALGISYNDEVIVPTYTFFATPEAVSLSGAIPVFVDCASDRYHIDPYKMDAAITNKTKAIISVHLYGQPAQLDLIKEIADKHNLFLIEDCSQAHIAEYKGEPVGRYGICGCFSFYPSKNLGAFGEGGAVITDNEQLYHKMRALRNHGSYKEYIHSYIGHNYRMEGFQGAVLSVKLKYLSDWTNKRRDHAHLYKEYLEKVEQVILPSETEEGRDVYHLFVIQAERRDDLKVYLSNNNIDTRIHYPIPCHLQKAYSELGYKKGDFLLAESYAQRVLSLPISPELTHKEIEYVSNKIIDFYKELS